MRIEPQKGKQLDKLPKRDAATFDETEFLVSTKYDGNQIWIVKKEGRVRYFTSDWKEFAVPHLDAELLKNKRDFILVGEFMYGCEGKLGDRRKSAILTTWRTNFAKGAASLVDRDKINIKVFDCILFNETNNLMITNLHAIDRLSVARLLFLPEGVEVVTTRKLTGYKAKIYAQSLVNAGWEGVMCITPNSTYQIGKRVNYSVKIKFRKTADLLCIDVEEGQGKCEGIGALVLQDSEGRVVRVGSGLDYAGDTRDGSKFIGKIIEIEYEQIMETYIQPVFKCIRPDKIVKDID